MARGQAYEGAPGPCVEVRAALAREIGEEDQPLGPGLDLGRFRHQRFEVGGACEPLADAALPLHDS